MKNIILTFLFLLTLTSNAQRLVEGTSIIRQNYIYQKEFSFERNWKIIGKFKSGAGESLEVFPIIFSTPDGKVKLHGLQINAFIKPAGAVGAGGFDQSGIKLNLGGSTALTKISNFIDKEDLNNMIIFIKRDIIPNLKTKLKKESKEFVFKTKEIFFSFLIDEKDLRITFHLSGYNSLGDNSGGESEFWTESQVDEMPDFLKALEEAYSKMN